MLVLTAEEVKARSRPAGELVKLELWLGDEARPSAGISAHCAIPESRSLPIPRGVLYVGHVGPLRKTEFRREAE